MGSLFLGGQQTQLDTLKQEHDDKLKRMEEEHQKALDALRADLPDLEKVKADAEVHTCEKRGRSGVVILYFNLHSQEQCRQKYENDIARERQDHESQLNRLQEVNRLVLGQVATLKSKAGETKMDMQQSYQRQLEEYRAKERETIEAEYAVKLQELDDRHKAILQQHEQEAEKRIEELKKQWADDHDKAVKALEKSHEEALAKAKSDAAVAVSREPVVQEQAHKSKADLNAQTAQLTTDHEKKLNDMQQEHNKRMAELEERLAKQKEEHDRILENHKQERDRIAAGQQDDVAKIKDQVAVCSDEVNVAYMSCRNHILLPYIGFAQGTTCE